MVRSGSIPEIFTLSSDGFGQRGFFMGMKVKRIYPFISEFT